MSEKSKIMSELVTIDKFKIAIEKRGDSIGESLKINGVSKERFVVGLYNAYEKTPNLSKCSQESVMGSIITCAELGLIPNTHEQLCFLIPYKRGNSGYECQFQLGYQGHLEIMHRNPNISHVWTDIVYDGDEFEEVRGAEPTLKHRPKTDRGSENPKATAVYACAKLKDGQVIFVVLYESDIEKFKKISQSASSNYSPWNSDKDPRKWMWRKTAIKQLAKELPKTPEMTKALYVDDVMETGGSIIATDEGEAQVIENEGMLSAAKKEEREKTASDTKESFKKGSQQNTELNHPKE